MASSTIFEKQDRVGLAYWMEEVLAQCAKAERDLSSDPVHDLRTALRRCRSLADGIRVFDRDPAWKKMRRAAKDLFGSLGELRDIHIMMEWVAKLSPAGDPTAKNVAAYLATREQEAQTKASSVLQNFDCRQWNNWVGKLPGRAMRVPTGSAVLAHLALERWHEAYTLHLRASRNRTNVGFHNLRIAIKRLRYTTENFLPVLHQSWSGDFKEIQDILGEIHDLDVLWQTAVQIKAFPDLAARAEWRTRLVQERKQRLDLYRSRMSGKNSLWTVWRESLPREDECRTLGLERLKIWAAFLDVQMSHSKHVAELSLQMFDGMRVDGVLSRPNHDSYRWILRAAALMHHVGRVKTNSGYHKASARLIKKLAPPLGWTVGELQVAALVARYHRGALPIGTQKGFAALSLSKQHVVQFLGGILRLACACDWEQNSEIASLQVESLDPLITVRAKGYVESTPLAEHIAAARHLLELTYRKPVFFVAAEPIAAEANIKVRAQAA
ncbi:MAG: CHAD domain-containing protein [Terriglobales bacterium]